MPSVHVVDVNESNYQAEIVEYSYKAPVIVDLWAEWCGPCRTLGPMLEKLAEEYNGAFRLAKIDVDANPNLASAFQASCPASVRPRSTKLAIRFSSSTTRTRMTLC